MLKTGSAAGIVAPLFSRAVITVAGIGYFLAGMGILVSPEWFFRTFANFPPFNRHYSVDLGAFLLALGGGLIIAARDPVRHRVVIWVAAIGSLLHAANHIYDVMLYKAPLDHWVSDTLPLFIVAALLIIAADTRTSEGRGKG